MIDNPIFKGLSNLCDMIGLALLWLLFSLPLITIGASTTALFCVALKNAAHCGGVMKNDFIKSFKSSFKIATLLFIVLVAVMVVLGFNISIIPYMHPVLVKGLIPFQYFLGIEAVIIALYAFPMLSRLDIHFKDLIKTAFIIAHKHFVYTLFVLLVTVLFCLGFYSLFPLSVLAVGIYANVIAFVLHRLLVQYYPDLKQEEDLN